MNSCISEVYAYAFVYYLIKILSLLIIFGHFNKRIQKSIDKTCYDYKNAVYYWTVHIRKQVSEFLGCKYTKKDKVTEVENVQWDILGLSYGIVMLSPVVVLVPFTLALGYWGIKLNYPFNPNELSSIFGMLDVFCKYGFFTNVIGNCLLILFVFCITSLITGIDFTFTDLRNSFLCIVILCLILAGYDKTMYEWFSVNSLLPNKVLITFIELIAFIIYIVWRWILAICWTFRRGDTSEVTCENEPTESVEPVESTESVEPTESTEPIDSTDISNSSSSNTITNIIQPAREILNVLRENGIDSYVGGNLRNTTNEDDENRSS